MPNQNQTDVFVHPSSRLSCGAGLVLLKTGQTGSKHDADIEQGDKGYCWLLIAPSLKLFADFTICDLPKYFEPTAQNSISSKTL